MGIRRWLIHLGLIENGVILFPKAMFGGALFFSPNIIPRVTAKILPCIQG